MSYKDPAHADKVFHGGPRPCRVALDYIGEYLVSTVPLMAGPQPYETMVFRRNSWTDLHCRRYDTRDEALAGHAEVKAALENGTLLGEAS